MIKITTILLYFYKKYNSDSNNIKIDEKQELIENLRQ